MSALFQKLIDWMNTAADRLSDFGTWLLEKATVIAIDTVTFFIESGGALVIGFLQSLTVWSDFTNSWTAIDPTIRAMLEILRVPEVIAIYLSAYIIRMVIGLIPGL